MQSDQTAASGRGGTPSVPTRKRLVGSSEATCALRGMIAAMAVRSGSVLVQGESGTGKELVASMVHTLSARCTGPFVPVDCTTLRDTLFESQLFGHVRGAFTGADRTTLGFVRSADRGTLFLDEIGELDLIVQAKLLRCLQEREVIPLGSTQAVPVDVRIVAATHRNLDDMVAKGRFRSDLYYRLKVLSIRVPTLRERAEDVLELADLFLGQCAELYAEPRRVLSSEAREVLLRYDWPGNIRELSNCMEYAHAMTSKNVIEIENLPPEIRERGAGSATRVASPGVPTLKDSERMLIQRALDSTGWNKSLAARILGVERRQLYRLLHQYHMGVQA